MSDAIKVEIDISQVQSLMSGLTPAAMQNAWRRSLRKVGNWAKGQTAKAVGKEMNIPQKILRQRIYFFLRSSHTGKVWLGLNALEAHRLGTPRQTKRGVTVGRHRFAGAWTMKKRAPSGPVYIRVGKERLPYRVVKVEWAERGEAAFREVATRIEERLLVVLRQEVNYEIQKASGNVR